MQHNDRENDIVQTNHPYKQYEQDNELSQKSAKVEKSKQSIKRDVGRKREEIKNSTIGGF